MSLQSCIVNNKLEKISPGEVCTIGSAKAKNLGIFDPKLYFPEGKFTTLKTYNSVKDAEDSRYHSLCSVNNVKNVSSPHCQIEHGVGFTNKPSLTPTCITAECPTEFTQDDKDPTICHKPVVEYVVPLGSRNDERWYDWYTVPNYHLGNKYGTSNFGPCPANNVPFYATDPVDNTNIDFTSKDQVSKCISKDIYFGGKYAYTPDYCPVAMVKRLGTTKQDIIAESAELLTKAGVTTHMESVHVNIADDILSNIDSTSLSDNSTPLSYEMITACRKVNTEDRLLQTYPICEKIKENEEEFSQYLLNIESELNDKRAPEKRKTMEQMQQAVKVKMLVLKKSCQSLFCNKMDDSAKLIDKEQICFPDIEAINMEHELSAYEKQIRDSEKPLPKITSDKEKKQLTQNMLQKVITWIKLLLVVVIGIFFYYKVWPWMRINVVPSLKKAINIITFGRVFKYIESSDTTKAKIAAEEAAEAVKIAAAAKAEKEANGQKGGKKIRRKFKKKLAY